MLPVDGKLTMTDVRVTNISDRDASTKSMLDGYDKTAAESILKSEAKQAREAAPRMESPRRPEPPAVPEQTRKIPLSLLRVRLRFWLSLPNIPMLNSRLPILMRRSPVL